MKVKCRIFNTDIIMGITSFLSLSSALLLCTKGFYRHLVAAHWWCKSSRNCSTWKHCNMFLSNYMMRLHTWHTFQGNIMLLCIIKPVASEVSWIRSLPASHCPALEENDVTDLDGPEVTRPWRPLQTCRVGCRSVWSRLSSNSRQLAGLCPPPTDIQIVSVCEEEGHGFFYLFVHDNH